MPYLGSFVDWLINRVPPLGYLIVQYAVPIAYGALCGVMCERAGVVNIGIEGMILTSAFVAFLTGAYLHPVVGVPGAAIIAIGVAIVASMLLSTLHAWLSITIKADQIISGTVINILALGGTAFFNQLLVSTTGLSGTNTLPRLDVPERDRGDPGHRPDHRRPVQPGSHRDEPDRGRGRPADHAVPVALGPADAGRR